jgi:hypothetical protein
MSDSELVFFMAPPTDALQKVVATRSPYNGRPPFIPSDTSDVYQLISKSVDTCGTDKIEMVVHRVIDTTGLKGSNVSYSLEVGTDMPFITAGIETKDTTDDYSKIPGHYGGNGFISKLKIRINDDGEVAAFTFDLYVIHGIVMALSWGLLGLI